MAKFLAFCAIAIGLSGCCKDHVLVFDVPSRPVLAEYTDQELRAVPISVLSKMAEETQEVQDYIDKVEARAELINNP